MAGFGKSAVVEALNGRLAEYKAKADEAHATSLESWEKQRATIQRAKKNLRQAVRDLTDGKIEIEVFAKRLNDSGDGYRRDEWTKTAARKVPKPPVRNLSPVERALASAIRLVDSASGESLTVSEMRQLGILDYVKG